MENKVELSWQGDMHFVAEGHEQIVNIDAHEEVGGTGKGVTPKKLMLTSLAGCSAMDIVSLLKKMRAEVDDIKIEVVANLTDEHPKYYDKVEIIYRFYGKDFKKDKIQKAIDLSVERYCGVLEMFKGFSELSTKVEYIEQ